MGRWQSSDSGGGQIGRSLALATATTAAIYLLGPAASPDAPRRFDQPNLTPTAPAGGHRLWCCSLTMLNDDFVESRRRRLRAAWRQSQGGG